MLTRFRSCFSVRTELVVAVLCVMASACSSAPYQEAVADDDQLLKPKVIFKVHRGEYFDSYFHDQAVAQAVQQAKSDPSEAVFRAYCQGGRQVRDLSYRIKVVPPAPPKGVAVDQAARIAADAAKQLRWVAQNFFRMVERPAREAKDPDLAFPTDRASLGGGLTGILTMAANIPAAREIQYAQNDEDESSCGFVFMGTGGATVLLADKRIFGDEGRYGSYAMEAEVRLRGKPFHAEVVRALPGEWAYLSRFVLLPPKKVLTAWLAHQVGLVGTAVSLDALYDEGGSIVIQEAIRNVKKLWDLYVLQYATSKTADQEDGATLVEVSLGLDGFCDYARSAEMLHSN